MTNKISENIEYTRRKWTGYMRLFGKFLYTERIHYFYLYKFLYELRALNENNVLLDIGFGSGYNIKKISKKFNIRTIGADIVQQTVDIYNKKNIKNSTAILIDPVKNKIPLKQDSVDIVVCSHVLEHVPNDAYILKEINRVIKKDGVLYLNVPINEEHINVPNHIRKYTPTSIKKILRDNGFKCIKEIESDIFTKWINYLGVHKNIFNSIIKKIFIFILSMIPIKFLEGFNGVKSQFVCFAKCKYSYKNIKRNRKK